MGNLLNLTNKKIFIILNWVIFEFDLYQTFEENFRNRQLLEAEPDFAKDRFFNLSNTLILKNYSVSLKIIIINYDL